MNLIDRLWKTSPETFTRAVKQRLDARKLKAGWTSVQDGVLKGAELLLPPEGTVWQEMIEGHYDQFLFDALGNRVNPKGKMFWDIGAHVGYHSLAFAALGADVLAFEPNAANVERLDLNVKRNQKLAPRIRRMAVAVSDSEGQISFRQSDELRGESMGGYVDRALPPLSEEAYATFHSTTVPTVTIDALIGRGERAPDILKVDVEGAEELVLQGGRKFLSEKSPVVLMEIHHICLMFSIQKLLLDWGYSTRILDKENASPSRCFIVAEK